MQGEELEAVRGVKVIMEIAVKIMKEAGRKFFPSPSFKRVSCNSQARSAPRRVVLTHRELEIHFRDALDK